MHATCASQSRATAVEKVAPYSSTIGAAAGIVLELPVYLVSTYPKDLLKYPAREEESLRRWIQAMSAKLGLGVSMDVLRSGINELFKRLAAGGKFVLGCLSRYAVAACTALT